MTIFKFILPYYYDVVDPLFNFEEDKTSKEYVRDRFTYGAHIWNIFKNDLPIDGILVSISVLKSIKRGWERALKIGIRNFLKLPQELRSKRFEVIGDCGAWQYIDQEEPPYDALEVLEYYQKLKVDYGVSVDHIASYGDAEKRIEITFRNAKKSYEYWKERYKRGEYDFILFGAIQGIEISDYLEVFKKLYNVGYRHVSLGGLARRSTSFICKLFRSLSELLSTHRDLERIHLLGVNPLRIYRCLSKLDFKDVVISVDNATFLRLAWSRSRGNYITPDGGLYTAIRVRPGSIEENKVLKALREYDKGNLSFEHTLEVLKEYVRKNGDSEYLQYYTPLLREKPWRKCGCSVCKGIGIDVVIFRGNDRNRRRGFHNIWVVGQMLRRGRIPQFKIIKEHGFRIEEESPLVKEIIEKLKELDISKVLIITNCTKEKQVDMYSVIRTLKLHGLSIPGLHDLNYEEIYRKTLSMFMKKAEDMYGGSFRYVKKLVNELRSYRIKTDIAIISARYGLITGEDIIIPYDASLKRLKANEIRKWAVKRQVETKLMKILENNYDLIIAILPREYAIAVRNVLSELTKRNNAILIIPSITKIVNYGKALTIRAGSLTGRIRAITALRRAIRKIKEHNLFEFT